MAEHITDDELRITAETKMIEMMFVLVTSGKKFHALVEEVAARMIERDFSGAADELVKATMLADTEETAQACLNSYTMVLSLAALSDDHDVEVKIK